MLSADSNGDKVLLSKDKAERLSSREMRNKAIAVIGMVSVAVAAYTGGSLTGSHLRSNKAEEDASSYGACDFVLEDWMYIDKKAAAERCIEKRTGKVAMVAFGEFSDKDLEFISQEADRLLIEGTEGLVDIDIIPIRATKEAQNELIRRNPFTLKSGEQCIDPDIFASIPSKVADDTMDLDDYSVVMGVTDDYPCRGIGGKARSEEALRYADSYAGDPDNIADKVAHEIGHTMGLGHGDRVTGLDINSNIALMRVMDGHDIKQFSELQRNTPDGINITDSFKHFSPKNYIAYGGVSELMADMTEVLEPKSLDLWKLSWPERVLGKQDETMHVINDRQDVRIAKPEEQNKHNSDFAVLELDEAIDLHTADVLHGNIRAAEYKTYSSLIIDPLKYGPKSESVTMNISLTPNDYRDTLSLGYIRLSTNTPDKEVLIIGGQTILLESVPGHGISVKDVTGQEQVLSVADGVGKSIHKAIR